MQPEEKKFRRTSSRFEVGMVATFKAIKICEYQGNEYPSLEFEGDLTVSLNDLKRTYAHTPLNGETKANKRKGTFVDAFWAFFNANKDSKDELAYSKFDDFAKQYGGRKVKFNLDFEYKNSQGYVRDFLKYDLLD